MVTLLDLFRKLEKMVPGDKSLGYLIRGDRKCPHTRRKKKTYYLHIFATPHKNVILVSMEGGTQSFQMERARVVRERASINRE